MEKRTSTHYLIYDLATLIIQRSNSLSSRREVAVINHAIRTVNLTEYSCPWKYFSDAESTKSYTISELCTLWPIE